MKLSAHIVITFLQYFIDKIIENRQEFLRIRNKKFCRFYNELKALLELSNK